MQRRELDAEEVCTTYTEQLVLSLQIDDIKFLFDYVDEDKDGFITFDELRKILIEADINMDFDLLFKLIEEINPEKKDIYDLDMIVHFFQIRPEDDEQ